MVAMLCEPHGSTRTPGDQTVHSFREDTVEDRVPGVDALARDLSVSVRPLSTTKHTDPDTVGQIVM